MNVKERFNNIINEVETQIEARSGLAANELADQVLEACGEQKNLLLVSAAFQFMTGKALIPYIEERQLHHALRYIRENRAVEPAMACTGFPDPFTFAAEFEQAFGFKPEEVQGHPEPDFPAPADWEACGARNLPDAEEAMTEEQAAMMKEHSDFLSSVMEDLGFDMVPDFGPGADDMQTASAQEEAPDNEDVALRLEYGYSVQQAESVARIAEKKKMDLYSAYVMASHLLQQFRMQSGEADPALEDMLYVYSAYDLSVPQAVRLVQDMKAAGIASAAGEPEELVNEVINGQMPYAEGRKIYDAYLNNRVDTNFATFLAKVQELGDINAAVEQFYDPESERILNDFFDMMRINFEDMSYFEQTEAERAMLEAEAKANGFRYDDAGDTEFDLGNLHLPGLDDLDF